MRRHDSYRIKRHRKRRHGASHFALVPFIDMMTILVVFLLAHTAEVDILPNTKNISIPQSLSERKPSAAVVVMVTKDSVFVDGKLVGSVADVVARPGPGFRAAEGGADGAERLASLRGAQKADIAKREVTIMGDKSTPYSVLKKIMFTCSDAEYGKVSFAVVERERAASLNGRRSESRAAHRDRPRPVLPALRTAVVAVRGDGAALPRHFAQSRHRVRDHRGAHAVPAAPRTGGQHRFPARAGGASW